MSSETALFVKGFEVLDGQTEGTVWVTDGTAAGTSQLPIAPDTGYQEVELIQTGGSGDFFLPFDNKLIFFNLEEKIGSSTGILQIYTTDGTASGTMEVSVSADDLINSLYAGDAAQFGNKFLIFDQAVSVTGQAPTVEFLVTDGTTAGTTTFTIAGPPLPLAFNPTSFFSYGNMVLFSATGYNGLNSLWISNGTAAGTEPLSVTGTGTGALGFGATDFTLFGDKILFGGRDAGGDWALWVTDATSTGTRELTSGDINPEDITVIGGIALFVSAPGLGSTLWVTDGTVGGTKELVVSGGVVDEPADLTTFGNKIIFTSAEGLLVSDGTSSGSFALTWAGSSPRGLLLSVTRSSSKPKMLLINSGCGSRMARPQAPSK